MGRLPFNPQNVVGAADSASKSGADNGQVTVSQLAAMIDRAVRDHVASPVKVVGEIGQFRERTHWYFDLKDAGAVVSCVMFQSAARRVSMGVPRLGQQVLATGRVEFYPKQGRTQFMVDRLEPIGAGALDLAYRQLCEELRARGWFSEDRKRPLPSLPRKIAVVTSRTAAALQDVLDTLRRRCPSLPVALVDVRVQGEGAAMQIARAVRAIGARHVELGIDVILVTRGGGSMEDLWAFNELVVAEAIVASPIPVVAAIGHETDITIAELVADLRAATPTQAAMRIAPDSDALCEQLRSLGARMTALVQRQLRADAQAERSAAKHLRLAMREGLGARMLRVDRLAGALERHRPGTLYAERAARLKHAAAQMRAAMLTNLRRYDPDRAASQLALALRASLAKRTAAVEAAARGLELVGPASVLKRGFSVTLKSDGSAIRSASEATPGTTLRTRVADGSFESVVTGPTDEPRTAKPARKPNAKPSHDQPALFSDLGGS